MYSLYYYAENYCYIGDTKGKEKDILVTRLKHSIIDTINALISIELSFNKGDKSNFAYGDKFLSLINGNDLSDKLGEIWKDYSIYAESQVKKRILRR